MRLSLNTFTHDAIVTHLEKLKVVLTTYRIGHLSSLALFLICLAGCMRIDQEVDRSRSMTEELSPSEVNDEFVGAELEGTDLDASDSDVTDPEAIDPLVIDSEMSDLEVTDSNPLEICIPQPVIYRNRWSIAPQLKAWVDELADLPCSLKSQELEPSISQLRGPARFGERGEESCDDEGCWVTL